MVTKSPIKMVTTSPAKKQSPKKPAAAESPLEQPLPALDYDIEMIDKKDISEIKSYNSPPPVVATVMNAVMILFNKETNWATAKKELADPQFM